VTNQGIDGSPEAPAAPSEPATAASGRAWLRDLDWRQFEELIGAAYRLQGFTVLPTSPGADGGIDLILTRGPERIFVQCKHWKAWQVGAPVIRELFGIVVANRATRGIVATSGTFSREAVEFARQSGTELLDGTAVLALLAAGDAYRLGVAGQTGSFAPPQAEASGTPSCPVCLSPMVLHRARRGTQAGSLFWGCVRFPGCRGTREAAPGTQLAPAHRQVARQRRGRRQPSLVPLVVSLSVLVVLPLGAVLVGGMLQAVATSPARIIQSGSAASPSATTAASIKGMGEQPMDIAVDAKGRRLYTANYVSGDLTVIDAATMTVVDTIDTPGTPVGVAVGGSTLYVADRAGKKVYAINLKTKKTTRTFATGHGASDIAVDSSAERLFVSHDDGTTHSYSTASGRSLTNLRTASGGSLAVDTSEHKLYANTGLGSLYTYDTRTLKITATTFGSSGGLAVDSKRQRLYVVYGSRLRERNLMTRNERTIDLEIDAQSVAVDPATRAAFVVDADAKAVQTVSVR